MKTISGDVYVKLSDLNKIMESDKYYEEEYAQLTEHVLRDPIIARPHRKHMPIVHVPIRKKQAYYDSDDDEEDEDK